MPRHKYGLVVALVVMVTGHVVVVEAGSRMIEPPARPSLWRYGFGTPVDFDDDEINCGGYDRQYGTNGGLCGVCGDPWDETPPRKYEAGNATTRNPRPVRVYRMGGDIPVVIESSAYLVGRYEFRLCALNSIEQTPTQTCFDDRPLSIRESELGHAYRIGQSGGLVSLHLVLPDTFTCTHCILQWRHVTGNRVNKDSCVQCGTAPPKCNFCQGCGNQAWFQTCSDIAIYDTTGSHPAVRGTLTSQEVKQRWEQTLKDLKGSSCPCNDVTTSFSSSSSDNVINASSPSPVFSTSDLSGSVTVTSTATSVSLTTSVSGSSLGTTVSDVVRTSASTVVDRTGGTSSVVATTTTATVRQTTIQTPPLTTNPNNNNNNNNKNNNNNNHNQGELPVFNPKWQWAGKVPSHRLTTSRPQTRICYVPYRPPWYLFQAGAWCFRNCPRAGRRACYFQTCRPLPCPSPSPTPRPTPPPWQRPGSGGGGGARRRNNLSWFFPLIFPEMFEL